jgi:hypothetical protein
MTDDLDLVLSHPLEEPVDAGFSARVVAGVVRMRARDEKIEIAAWTLAACCILTLLPMTTAGQAVALSASQISTSAAFALGIALLFLPRLLLDAMPD